MIEARGLVKHYRSTLAVDNLSFDVRPGTVTGFLGPNGAGKSTTMRMIMGLDRPDAGQARIGGKSYGDLRWPRATRSAGRGSRRCSPSPASRRPRTAGPGSSRSACPSGWGIAAALLGDPRVLLLDEPVNGLDPEGIRWIRNMLKNLAAQGRTVLVSSHLISEIAHTADALIVIGQGRLLAQTTVAQLSARSSSLEEAFFQLTDGVTDYSGSL
jgi:ABC-2 type transport system ATP-binding protein